MINVKINTLQEEVRYICGLFKRMEKFITFGYDLSLPDTENMKGIIENNRNGELQSDLYHVIYEEIEKVYNREDYRDARDQVLRIIPVIEACMPAFKQYEEAWGFWIFPKYNIHITAYGPGGSYDPESGKIVMKRKKCFMHPHETSVHEMVHIGIEKVIIERFNIPHRIKERIVDMFMVHHFKEQIPSYEMRDMGDSIIDEYLNHEDSWIRLPYYIGKFKEKEMT